MEEPAEVVPPPEAAYSAGSVLPTLACARNGGKYKCGVSFRPLGGKVRSACRSMPEGTTLGGSPEALLLPSSNGGGPEDGADEYGTEPDLVELVACVVYGRFSS